MKEHLSAVNGTWCATFARARPGQTALVRSAQKKAAIQSAGLWNNATAWRRTTLSYEASHVGQTIQPARPRQMAGMALRKALFKWAYQRGSVASPGRV